MKEKEKLLSENGYVLNLNNLYYEKGNKRISKQDVVKCGCGELEVRLILKETEWPRRE